MSSRRELLSPATRIALRELVSTIPVRQINNLWQAEGFAPDPLTYERLEIEAVLGDRQRLFQSYLDAVDWADERHVARALRVIERLLEDHYFSSNEIIYHRARRELERDGYKINDDGHITRVGVGIRPGALANLTDATAINDGLQRIRRAEQHDDPALVIGAAKELIESTAKLVLHERGHTVDLRADVQDLIRAAQKALLLQPTKATGPDGTDAVKKILGSASAIAVGVAELRNRGYGTGHGPVGARHGLRPRHAHLAANAAITWCELMLETLADPEAPWRTPPPATAITST
ncbi:abortive infection family protein [Sphaerimonospora mesophila]|uniref:abortive infection family protein n=1 Tax=Sphaerimonospora mesophila TaxID=37483 RepID=UPI0009FA5FD5